MRVWGRAVSRVETGFELGWRESVLSCVVPLFWENSHQVDSAHSATSQYCTSERGSKSVSKVSAGLAGTVEKFMAPCYLIPAILVRNSSIQFLWRPSYVFAFSILQFKNSAYKTKYEPEDIWILFVSKN